MRSVLDMATFATADTNTDYLYNNVLRNYRPKFKPNPNEKIESVVKSLGPAFFGRNTLICTI